MALENVTPILEQTLIEYRLSSFTIKSRRNVDFRNVGFYIPDFKSKNGEPLNSNVLKLAYKNYMKELFNKYGEFVDEELPVEDCRYILPYSYYSNIIMGCDANELFRITGDLLYGKLSKITEAKELGENFERIIRENIPYLSKALDDEKEKKYYIDKFCFLDNKVSQEDKLLDKANLIDYQENADDKVLCSILTNRYQLSYEQAEKVLNELSKEDSEIKNKMMKALIQSKSQRELEQVSYTFELPISLAVLTHMTRHRMHSLLVPDFTPLWNLDNYVIPDTIKEKYENEYKEIFENNKIIRDSFKKEGVRDEDLVYFYLSGNACNIQTTMNARTLEWISRMRTCKKAQWEIRHLVENMVEQVKEVNPLIGTALGPTCTIEGYCPEGKDSCKERGIVVKQKKI